MIQFLLILPLLVLSGSAWAALDGSLVIAPGNAQATLEMTESGSEGALSELFERMTIPDTGDSAHKVKKTEVADDRFEVDCEKTRNESPTVTHCVWIIKNGSPVFGISTVIFQLGTQKIATLGLNSRFSGQLAGIFPANSSGASSLDLRSDNRVSIQVNGSTADTMAVAFSAK